MVFVPGSFAVKQNCAWPLESVVAEPLEGEAAVVAAPDTENTTVTPEMGFPNESVTVAVTQWVSSTGSVSVAGVSVNVAAGPAVHVFVASPKGSPAFWVLLLFVSA